MKPMISNSHLKYWSLQGLPKFEALSGLGYTGIKHELRTNRWYFVNSSRVEEEIHKSEDLFKALMRILL